jgi:putative membrane protein
MSTSHPLTVGLAFTNGPGWHWAAGGVGWWWLLGPLTLVLLLAAFAVVVWLLVRTGGGGNSSVDRAQQILRERYAQGEIDADEYQQRKSQLD